MMEALKSLATFEPLAYLVLLYGTARLAAIRGNGQQRFVVDVIALVWVLCSIIREAFGQYEHVIFGYMMVDIGAALWLAAKVRGKVSGLAETLFLAMILFHYIIWARGEVDSWLHWTGAAALSVTQIVLVAGGICRHELRGLVTRAAARIGLRRAVEVYKTEVGK